MSTPNDAAAMFDELQANANAYNEEVRRQAAIAGGHRETIPFSWDLVINDNTKKIALDNLTSQRRALDGALAAARIHREEGRASVDVGVGVLKDCGHGNDGEYYRWEPLTCNSIRSNYYYSFSGGCGSPGWWIFPATPCWDGRMGCHWDCYRTRLPGTVTGRSIGRANLDQHDGWRLRCPASHPDRIDGLCYRSCPRSHPHHLDGMPYLCGRSRNTHDVIRDQAEWDFWGRDEAEAEVKCLEATINRNQGQLEEYCGYDGRESWRAVGEEIARVVAGYFSAGLTELVSVIPLRGQSGMGDFNKNVFGHYNRQNPGGAMDRRVERIVQAFGQVSNMVTEEACLKAIEEQDPQGFLAYCPLFQPVANEAGELKKDAEGNVITQAILPSPIGDNGLEWDVSGNFPEWDVPQLPGFDESQLPQIPEELLAEMPSHLLPSSIPDMVPFTYPSDVRQNPTDPLSNFGLRQGETDFKMPKLFSNPNFLLGAGLVTIMLLTAK